MKIGIVTCTKLPMAGEDEQTLIRKFFAHGINAESVVWTDINVDWKIYDLLIIRTVWDYHLKLDLFLLWLEKIENTGVRVLNPVEVIRFNSHKFYLKELKELGIEIIPTRFLEKSKIFHFELIANLKWDQIVIKPAVSASSYKTGLFFKTQEEEIRKEYHEFSKTNDLLIQKFIPEIQSFGELSIVFINKNFSHCILKRASKGEYRVQSEFGGSAEIYNPPDHIIKEAQNILHHIKDSILFARVDGTIINDRFILMELELIEPDLFLSLSEQSFDKFIRATSRNQVKTNSTNS